MPLSIKERLARQLFAFYVRDVYGDSDEDEYKWQDAGQLAHSRFYKDADKLIAILSIYPVRDLVEICRAPREE